MKRIRPLPALQWTTATAVFLRPKVWTCNANGEGDGEVSSMLMRLVFPVTRVFAV